MKKYHIELIGTIISCHAAKKKLQIIIGQAHDIINDTQHLTTHDIITLRMHNNIHYLSGKTVHIKGHIIKYNENYYITTHEIHHII